MYLVENFRKYLTSSASRTRYKQLADDYPSDNQHDAHNSFSSHLKWRGSAKMSSVLSLSLWFLPIILVIIIGLLVLSRNKDGPPTLKWTNCGDSPAEARARGCHFEPMMSAWIPKECYFEDLKEDHEDIFETWKWYWDKNVTHEIKRDEMRSVREGDYHPAIFTTKPAAHLLHCLYALRKLATAVEKRSLFLDSRSLRFHHSTHCAKGISTALQGGNPDPPISTWPLLFHDCIPLPKGMRQSF